MFNALTGARQHVGNYPGVTVEKKEGRTTHQGREIRVVDLPGAYSLTAYSLEERVARDFLIQTRPQVVVDVVDAANLDRNLYLAVQFLELGIPLVIALNMVDVAQARGLKTDVEALSRQLGVPVVPTVARSAKGIDDLLSVVVELADQGGDWHPKHISYGHDLDQKLKEMVALIEEEDWRTDIYPPRWLALKFLEADVQIRNLLLEEAGEMGQRLMDKAQEVEKHLDRTLDETPEGIIADYRYGFITSLTKTVVSRKQDLRLHTSDKVDKFLLNRLFGPLALLAVLYGMYEFTFSASQAPVGWFEAFFSWLGATVESILPQGLLRSLLVSGIIDGVGGVLGFVPLIAFMFFAIAILEDSGYMARIAFIMDRILRIFGLHGASVLSLIVAGGVAGGCAVPAVMAARTLRDPKERLATILVAPMMNCGAKLPVYAMLIAAFFSKYKANMLFGLTLISWVMALTAALILRSTVLKGQGTPFVMELPPYRLPTMKGLLIHTWERTWAYVKKAGTVILAISVIMWALMTFPGPSPERQADFEARRAQLTDQAALTQLEAQESKDRLIGSLAGGLGRGLTWLTSPLGFDWRTNVALVGGFAAKEVVLSTLGTVYSIGAAEEDESASLAARLKHDPDWSPLKAFTLILFVMIYAPCFAAVAVIKKEAGWRWALFDM
ncbi:MAG: ferrous iron transport protein B, partial [Deltaproteobacteria bacterium]|nr:ferrous iron transport protein B [Deltaproteobacteria bacterium]